MATATDTHPVAPAQAPKEDFSLYACWHRSRVYEVMNTEAEKIPDDVFLAVHTSYPLNLVNPDRAVSGVQEQVTPETFLKRFLDERQPHVQAVVLGNSGSGKSHFIQWLRLNIPENPKRIVISIPRAGTGLRGVVKLLISNLPEAAQDVYLDKLRAAGGDHEPTPIRRQRLCSEIALALAMPEVLADRPGQTANPVEEQVRAELAELLPSFFRDPALIPVLTRDGGFIAALVEHIDHGAQGYRPVDQPSVFTVQDLSLALPERTYGQLGESARLVYDQLENAPELRAVALSIINSALQAATRQMLSLASNDLGNLMADIRRHFKRQDKHLVLLIEDFAILRGIDRPLLDALIESGQGTDLCSLRWAMAVTTGYYGRIENTVQTRTNIVVDMDLPRDAAESRIGIAKTLSDDEVLAFAARYLNVARMPKAELRTWHEASPELRTPVPNACGLCPHAQDCHASFGEAGGMGLYPFNRTALLMLARSQDEGFNERFNPRSLIRQVLAPMLDLGPVATTAHAIEVNSFPPEALLQRVGGSRIDDVTQDQWRRDDPADGPRQITLTTLWGDQNRRRLELTVYRAFGIREPSGIPDRPDPIPPREKKVQDQVEQKRDPDWEALSAWVNNNTSLPQALTNKLRGLVFDALSRHIDWDQAGLSQSDFFGRQQHFFRPEYIIFQNPAVRPNQLNVNRVYLNIPLSKDNPEDLRQAGIALQALVYFDSHKQWQAAAAPPRLPYLANCLEQWSDALLSKFNVMYKSDAWDPAASAAELLALGATLVGRSAADSSVLDLHGMLFTEWPEEPPVGTTGQWRNTYKSIYSSRAILTRALRSVASGTKGGQAGRFLDASRTLPSVRALQRRHWRVDTPLPRDADLPDPYGRVAKVHREVFGKLESAVQEALDQRRKWLADVRQAIAPDTTRAALIDELDSVKNAAFQVGIAPTDSVRRKFEEALNGFRNVQYQAAVDAAERVIADASRDGTDDPLRVLPALGRTRTAAVEATSALIAAAPPYLNGIGTQLTLKRQQFLTLGAGRLSQDKAAIKRDLVLLISLLGSVVNNLPESARISDAPTRSQPAADGSHDASALSLNSTVVGESAFGVASNRLSPEAPAQYLLDRVRALRLEIQDFDNQRKDQGDADRFRTRASALSEATRAINPLASLAPVFARGRLEVNLPTALVTSLREQAADILERFEANPESITEADAGLKGSFWDPLATLTSQRLRPAFIGTWHRHVDATIPPMDPALIAHLKVIPSLTRKVERIESLTDDAQLLRQALPTNADTFSQLATVGASLNESLHELFGTASGAVPPEVLAFLEQASAPGGATIEFLTPEVRDWLTSRDLLASLRLRWQGAAR